MSAWALLYCPVVLTVYLQPIQNAPLSILKKGLRSFGNVLSPDTFSAQIHSTSELLRFL